mmetsp:Transcript_13733/g.33127  ORF Transcript_13733/g.33127 Transcript_13733/m.33127 type:complete len:95 (+) Transcript_13733:800-1084(+)
MHIERTTALSVEETTLSDSARVVLQVTVQKNVKGLIGKSTSDPAPTFLRSSKRIDWERHIVARKTTDVDTNNTPRDARCGVYKKGHFDQCSCFS